MDLEELDKFKECSGLIGIQNRDYQDSNTAPQRYAATGS
jgi:hypothetical protein